MAGRNAVAGAPSVAEHNPGVHGRDGFSRFSTFVRMTSGGRKGVGSVRSPVDNDIAEGFRDNHRI